MAMVEEHVFAGVSFPGRPKIKEIAQELQRQKSARKDAVIRSDRMELKLYDNQFLLDVPFPKQRHLVPMSATAWNQLWGWMGLPKRSGYYNWLMKGAQHMPRTQREREKIDSTAHWGQALSTVNDFLRTEAEHRTVRLMDKPSGERYCRAMLSDKYKIIPNDQYFEAIVDRLLDAKAEIWHARLSEDKFMIYAVAPELSAQVQTERSFDPGDGWQSRWYGEKGDVYNAALSAWNSQAMLRRVCANYCVWQDIVTKTHVGRRRGDEQLLSEETIRLENKVFFEKIRDYVESTFEAERFQKIVDAVNGATEDGVDPEKAEEAAESLQLVYGLSDERMKRIRQLFYQEGDYSRHGLSNAVTRAAHDGDVEAESGFEMERTGAEIMRTPVEKILYKGAKLRDSKAAKEQRGSSRVLAGVSSGNDEFFDIE